MEKIYTTKKNVKYYLQDGAVGREDITDFRQTSSCFNAHEVNPAIGCDFQCKYCSMYAQFQEDAHTPVVIFKDYPEYLREYIRKCNNKEKLIFNFSPKTDAFAYSMIESGMTEEILRVFNEEKVRYYILTKGETPPKSILNLLEQSKDRNQIIFSSGLLNEELENLLEPGAPNSSKRMDFARECQKIGVTTTGIAAPYLPINDDNYAESVLSRFYNAGIKHVSVQVLKLSIESLDKLCILMPQYEQEFRKLFSKDDVKPVEWKLPGGKTVTRYFASTNYLQEELLKVKQIALKKGMTVSTCKEICNSIKDPSFNKEALSLGYNCVGFIHWK